MDDNSHLKITKDLVNNSQSEIATKKLLKIEKEYQDKVIEQDHISLERNANLFMLKQKQKVTKEFEQDDRKIQENEYKKINFEYEQKAKEAYLEHHESLPNEIDLSDKEAFSDNKEVISDKYHPDIFNLGREFAKNDPQLAQDVYDSMKDSKDSKDVSFKDGIEQNSKEEIVASIEKNSDNSISYNKSKDKNFDIER